MRIGIDAKRIFMNKTGLGSYGRNLVNGLNQLPNENMYFLYTPEKTVHYDIKALNENISSKVSTAWFKILWRSFFIKNDLKKDKIDLYHAISNELPFTLNRKVKNIVDIHDLLFIRFPQFYSFFDRVVFKIKTKSACEKADKIIATSEATKADIVKYYQINPEKIEVVYQSCDASFFKQTTAIERKMVREKYRLPNDFLLCVGTIQERKNQMQILEALLRTKVKLPLVLVGSGRKYKDEVIEFAKQHDLELIIPKQFVKNEDLPSIYQMAKIFVFPGFYEGFGIPVLEAMASKTQVITSINTSMSEIAPNTKNLVNPISVTDLADKIDLFLEDEDKELIEANYKRALDFTNVKFAKRVLKVYDEVSN
jgi:glycosyltransferase involved in cell wall biosynthesis